MSTSEMMKFDREIPTFLQFFAENLFIILSLGITCPTEGYFNLKTEKVKIFGFHPKPSKYQSGVPRQKFLTSRQILAIFSRFDKNFFLGTPYQRYDFLGNFLLFFRSFTYLAHLSFSFKFWQILHFRRCWRELKTIKNFLLGQNVFVSDLV